MPARPDGPPRDFRATKTARSATWGGNSCNRFCRQARLVLTSRGRRGERLLLENSAHRSQTCGRGEHDASIADVKHGHRSAQREDRLRLQPARPARLRGERGQRDDPLRLQLLVERLARTAVVHVRDPGDVRRLLHFQAQRACARRDLLSVPDRARPALARHDRHAVLPDPGLPAARLSVLAVLHAGLCGRRDVG